MGWIVRSALTERNEWRNADRLGVRQHGSYPLRPGIQDLVRLRPFDFLKAE
jgi:hypothetical protein